MMREIKIKMKLFFPYPDRDSITDKATLRTVKKLDIAKSDFVNHLEIVVSKDFVIGETLLASPTGGRTNYTGRLYEKLLNLKISLNPDQPISPEDKDRIMDFVGSYAQPRSNSQEMSAQIRADPNTSWDKDRGDEINWLFFPYTSKPQDRTRLGFFESFQNMYRDFIGCFEIIESRKTFGLGGLRTVFDNALAGNRLTLNPAYDIPPKEVVTESGERITIKHTNEHSIDWVSETSIDLCYLELYSLLISRQSIKICKYCNERFESSKSNEVRCRKCRVESVSRKMYYRKNIHMEREKARIRMAKKRQTPTSSKG